MGPQLRSPSGGYLVAATKARASAGVLIIGEMMPSRRNRAHGWRWRNPDSGTRTTGARRPAGWPRSRHGLPRCPHRPCCISTVTAQSLPAITQRAAARPSRTSPNRRSRRPACRASEKDSMGTCSRKPFPCGSPARLDLGDRLGHQLVHGAANLGGRTGSRPGIEILADPAERRRTARLHIRDHDFLRHRPGPSAAARASFSAATGRGACCGVRWP